MEENKETQKRQTAIKVKVSDILEARFVKAEGWNPNYVITKRNVKVSRLNLIAIVVSTPQAGSENEGIIVDDGSGRINLRTFDNQEIFHGLNVGYIILIIGRPRQYANEMYITPEIIRKIENKAWVELRRKELDSRSEEMQIIEDEPINDSKSNPQKLVHIENIEEEIVEESIVSKKEEEKVSSSQELLKIIKKYDDGAGADIDAVLQVFGNPQGEQIIKSLLSKGEIFEIKAGRLKVLE